MYDFGQKHVHMYIICIPLVLQISPVNCAQVFFSYINNRFAIMSTEYDTIQGPHNYDRNKSIAFIEHEIVQTTIAPFTQDTRVLELACGTGFYTYNFLKWGASAVARVNVLSAMIKEARQNYKESGADFPSPNIDFVMADCARPNVYADGPFDLAFKAWLLNYAPDHFGLVDIFRNITLDMKDGKRFVSIKLVPDEDPTAFVPTKLNTRPPLE